MKRGRVRCRALGASSRGTLTLAAVGVEPGGESEATVKVLSATKQPVWGLAFSPDGRYLAAGGGPADARVWDTAGGAKPAKLADTREVIALAFVGDKLLVSCRSREPRALTWPGVSLAVTTPAWSVWASYSVAFAPDGHVVHGSHEKLGCWDALTGRHLWNANPGRYWSHMAVGPGNLLAVVTDYKHLARWDRATGVRTATAELDTDSIIELACSPDGGTVALSTGRDVILWDVKTWTERARRRFPSVCQRLAYHPSGDRLLACAKSLRLLTADLETELRAYDFATPAVLSAAFAPDGLRAAVGCDKGTIVVWDIDD